ncbi:lysophospholipid acyltransferase family protein [Verticiella sediminum]|uniref:Lysophospholipid acyltransferase family protein n=1 Tax=Verticiella sediminum TaxID=1247510 RepID=A0A556AB17_9BURK|nr:lysophospholipid acyltransferase family protein [Verticiella sediminum]TSH90068.1 lysophospholipid acyltransferase family protein [Verticiella sediminum]
MLVFVFRLLSHLPLAWLHAVGRLLGRLVYALPGRYRRRLRAHAAQAGYPDAAFARRAAAETGASMLELPWVWFRTADALARVHSTDDHLIEAARAAGKSILFVTPHLGGFEMSARYATRFAPITVLYRPPRQAALATLIEAARADTLVEIAPASVAGVRQLLRTLRGGGQVGILPDQVPGKGEGAWADFFGRPAYTMTLPARLASSDKVAVIAAACERLPRGRGWRLHLAEVAPPPAGSGEAAAAWINQAMQSMIRRCPQQYLWSYNRYKNP